MKRCTALLLLILCGCPALPSNLSPQPAPTPASTSPVEDAAAKSITDYATGLAANYETVASKADQYHNWSDATEALATANKATRESAFRPATEALDRAIGYDASKPDSPPAYQPETLKRELQSMARGLRRGVAK